MVAILMMSGKLASLGLLKVKLFWSKGYGFIIFAHEVTKQIFTPGSNYIADVVMLPKLGNSSISMGEVIITTIL